MITDRLKALNRGIEGAEECAQQLDGSGKMV